MQGLFAWSTADAAVPKLIGLLSDKDGFFVSTVIESLGRFKDLTAVEPLLAVAKEKGGEVERALIQIGPSAEPLLLKAAAGGDVDAQKAALKALGEVGSENSLPLLKKLAATESPARGDAENSLRRIERRIQ